MVVFRRVVALAALAAAMLLLSACERKITRVEVVQEPQNCFDCHSDSPADTLHLVAARQQWENSRHASGGTLNENDSSCKNCHTSEGFVARAAAGLPFTANTTGSVENPTSIHCFTCHAPHSDGNFGLRWTAITTLQDGTTADLGSGNLCAACHQSRRNINTYATATTTLTNRWGPHHSNQADLLLGTNGYEYVGYTYETTNHASATEDGCIDCHMKTTLQNVVGGHAFNMEWTEGTEEILNVAACTDCHGEIDDFNEVTFAGVSLQDSVEVLVGDLRTRLVTAGLVDGTTGLPKSVSTARDSAGAVWNYLFVEEDRSKGVHNPKYAIGLLHSAIQYIDGDLPQPAPAHPLARAVTPGRN